MQKVVMYGETFEYPLSLFFFFLNDTAPPEISPLPLPDLLPIYAIDRVEFVPPSGYIGGGVVVNGTPPISGTNQSLAGSTAIWDAVWATSEELISSSAEHTRRAIILLTDGDDTSSRMKMHEAIERALKADALIYAIGIGDRYTFNVDEGALRKIAEQTGGRAYFPRHERDLRVAFC